MGNYFEYKNSQKAMLTHELQLFYKFHRVVFEEKTLAITDEEMKAYQECRLADDKDYRRRKIMYGPSLLGGFILFDAYITIPNTKNNIGRGFFNLVVGLPVSAVFSMLLLFHKEQLESHKYAFKL
eukprot:CAMPEP_0204917696 /NCGR_PEP_ID=MMETSP1397-20131031/15319_1 /ASSEMBLY_ACC=CAM_ASM_000891 /TAXON_ID=49980 /ORGANISM="Climacostomum Climacostomum virens, Strain Stock W-24" /LENGTH=124 /DNA_ID=CAMNT_0052090613 /DNA_START=261 /DNA_END=632 /DNA_ORIENTATION=-